MYMGMMRIKTIEHPPYPMSDEQPNYAHPFEKNQVLMDTNRFDDRRILDEEWFEDTYPTIFARVMRLEPELVSECKEVSKNTSTYIFAVREFTRMHFQSFMKKSPLQLVSEDETEELDEETKSAIVQDYEPDNTEVQPIPEMLEIVTDHGSETFERREIEAMIRTSGPMS